MNHLFHNRYVFCDNTVVVPPTSTTSVVRFDHTQYFTQQVSEEFIDYCSDSALSIEVWGHRGNHILQQQTSTDSTLSQSSNNETNNNSVTDRWKEVTSQMKLWVEIQVRIIAVYFKIYYFFEAYIRYTVMIAFTIYEFIRRN